MDELISRKAAVEELERLRDHWQHEDMCYAIDVAIAVVKNVPADSFTVREKE